MTEVKYNEYLSQLVEKLGSGGLFLTTGTDKPNIMTIGWSSVGIFWGKLVFIVPVRLTRYSHQLIEESGEFTVSVPLEDMKKELDYCGSKSGRDVDKFKQLGLTSVQGKRVKVPVIGECDIHYECRVMYKQDMKLDSLEEASKRKFYAGGDIHTMYYGEILSCYKK